MRGALPLAVMALAAACAAQEARVSARVEPAAISMGGSAQLTVSIEGVEQAGRPLLPPLPDFDVMAGGTMQSTRVVNGAVTRSLSYSYTLLPRSEGTFTIPPIEVEAGGRTLRTEALTVTVGKAPQGEGTLALWVEPQKQEVYLYEPVRVDVALGFDKPLADGTLSTPWLPELENFRIEYVPPEPGRRRVRIRLGQRTEIEGTVSQRVVDGAVWDTYEFSVLLIPLAAGRHELAECVARGDLVIGHRQGRWPFHEKEPVTRRSAANSQRVSINVLPLPAQGKPNDFSGGVGSFDLSVSVDPQRMQAGDAVTVKAVVSGSGYVDAVRLPPLQSNDHWRAYEQEAEVRSEVGPDGLSGRVTFTQALIPLSENAEYVPAVTLSYFDPEAGRYKSQTAGPTPIQVLPADEGGGAVVRVIAGETRQRVREVGSDIFDIVPDAPAGAQSAAMPSAAAATLPLVALPPALWAAVTLLARKKRRLAEDVGLARSTRAYRSAMRRMRELQAGAQTGADVCHAAARTLMDYVSDKLARPRGEMTAAELRELLRPCVGDELAEEAAACIAACDLGRFGGAETDAAEIIERATRAVTRLERGRL